MTWPPSTIIIILIRSNQSPFIKTKYYTFKQMTNENKEYEIANILQNWMTQTVQIVSKIVQDLVKQTQSQLMP
jgi:ribosomal protein S18